MALSERRQWADAYLDQAREDLIGATALEDRAPSVSAMLLQMVLEKTAKGLLIRSGSISVEAARRSHKAASSLVAALKRNRELLRLLELGDQRALAGVLSVVVELERAHPQLAQPGAPQLEYPWADAGGGPVCCPARDLPIAKRWADPISLERPRMIRFAKVLLDRADSIFPC